MPGATRAPRCSPASTGDRMGRPLRASRSAFRRPMRARTRPARARCVALRAPWRIAGHLGAVERGRRRRALARPLVRRTPRLRARGATSGHGRAPRPARPGDPAASARRTVGGRERTARPRVRELRGRHRPPLRGEPAPRCAARPRRDGAPRAPHRTRRRVALPLRAGLCRDGVQRDGQPRRRSTTSACRRCSSSESCPSPVRPPAGRASGGTGRPARGRDRAGRHSVLWDALDETADAVGAFLAR